MVLVSDDGWVPGSFFGVYHLKGLRAELRNGESGTQVCSLCGSKWEGKGHGGGGCTQGSGKLIRDTFPPRHTGDKPQGWRSRPGFPGILVKPLGENEASAPLC